MNPQTSRRRDIDDDLSSIQRVRHRGAEILDALDTLDTLDTLVTHLALCGVEYREQITEYHRTP